MAKGLGRSVTGTAARRTNGASTTKAGTVRAGKTQAAASTARFAYPTNERVSRTRSGETLEQCVLRALPDFAIWMFAAARAAGHGRPQRRDPIASRDEPGDGNRCAARIVRSSEHVAPKLQQIDCDALPAPVGAAARFDRPVSSNLLSSCAPWLNILSTGGTAKLLATRLEVTGFARHGSRDTRGRVDAESGSTRACSLIGRMPPHARAAYPDIDPSKFWSQPLSVRAKRWRVRSARRRSEREYDIAAPRSRAAAKNQRYRCRRYGSPIPAALS